MGRRVIARGDRRLRMAVAARFAAMLLAAMCAAVPAGAEKVYSAVEEPMHRAVLHNELLDVYDVDMQAGEQTFYHRHTRDQLAVILRTGAAANQLLGEPETVREARRGTIAYLPHSVTGGYTHRVRAIDPYRVIGIEFAASGGSGATAQTAEPGTGEIRFPQGRLTRVTIAPGAARQITGALILAMAPGTLAHAGGQWSLADGDVKWVGGAPATTYTSVSKEPIVLLVLSLGE